MATQKDHELCYDELRPYHRLILDLARKMPKNRVREALAQQGISAKSRAVRKILDRDLRHRVNRNRSHVKRMYGIYMRWKASRNIKIEYKGQPQSYANLKANLMRPGKRSFLDNNTLMELQDYSGPTPAEIYYYDDDDRCADLLGLDKCPWNLHERQEALAYISNHPKAFCHAQESTATWLNTNPASSEDKSRVSAGLQSHHVSTTTGLALRSEARWVYSYINFLLSNDRLDEAYQVASEEVISNRLMYGEQDLSYLLVSVGLARVLNAQGQYGKARQLLEPIAQELRSQKSDSDDDVLRSVCLLSDILLNMGKVELATKVSREVLLKQRSSTNSSNESIVLFKLQFAQICNANERYDEGRDILYDDHSELLETIRSGSHSHELESFGEQKLRELIELASSLCGLGHPEATRLCGTLEQEFSRRESNGIPRKIWNLEMLFQAGVLQCELRAWQEAQNIFQSYKEALWRIIPFNGHPKNILADVRVANCLYHQHNSKAAITIYEKVIPLAYSVWGARHPWTLTLLSNRAWAAESVYDQTAFKKQVFEVRDLRAEYLGEEHPDTIDSKQHCAYVTSLSGQWEDALKMLDEIQRTQKKATCNSERLRLLQNLSFHGEMLGRKGDHVGAIDKLSEALHLGRRLFGHGHPKILPNMLLLAESLVVMTQYEEAEELLKGGISEMSGHLGAKHCCVMQVEKAYATVLAAKGNLGAATELLCRVYKEEIARYRVDHPYVIRTAEQLGRCYAKQNEVSQGRKVLETAIVSSKVVFGSDYRLQWSLQSSLMWILRLEGNPSAAYALVQDTQAYNWMFPNNTKLDELETGWSMYDEIRLNLLQEAALIEGRFGNFSKSVALFEKILGLRRRFLGSDHPDTIFSMSELANGYNRCDDNIKAEQMYDEAIERSSRVFGLWHPRTIEHKIDRCGVLLNINRQAEAESQYMDLLGWIFDNKRGELRGQITSIYRKLAYLHYVDDQPCKAMKFLELILLECTSEQHALSIDVRIDLANCCLYSGEFSRAMFQAEAAVCAANQCYGSSHSLSFRARQAKIVALYAAELYGEGDELSEGLRQDIESAHGSDTLLLVEPELTFSRSLCSQGRLTEAELFLDGCVHRRGRQNLRSPKYADLRLALGEVKGRQGKLEEKYANLEELKDDLNISNPRSWLFVEVLMDLAEIKAVQQEHLSASAMMSEVIDICRKRWGNHSVQAFQAESRLLQYLPIADPKQHFDQHVVLAEKYATFLRTSPRTSSTFWREAADRYEKIYAYEELSCRVKVTEDVIIQGRDDLQYLADLQRTSSCHYRFAEFSEAESALERSDLLIGEQFPDQVQHLTWVLELLSRVKIKLGKYTEMAEIQTRLECAAAHDPDYEPELRVYRKFLCNKINSTVAN